MPIDHDALLAWQLDHAWMADVLPATGPAPAIADDTDRNASNVTPVARTKQKHAK